MRNTLRPKAVDLSAVSCVFQSVTSRLSLRSLLTINCLDHKLPDHKLPGAAVSMFFGVAATKRRLWTAPAA